MVIKFTFPYGGSLQFCSLQCHIKCKNRSGLPPPPPPNTFLHTKQKKVHPRLGIIPPPGTDQRQKGKREGELISLGLLSLVILHAPPSQTSNSATHPQNPSPRPSILPFSASLGCVSLSRGRGKRGSLCIGKFLLLHVLYHPTL